VRVFCFSDRIEKARELVDKTGDRAGAYHLARQYEDVGRFEEAIKFFTKSECYNNAIRLAKEHGMRTEMLSLALRSTKADMIEAAEYYESQPNSIDKAVTLYHKGGRVTKALELCFKHKLYQELGSIAEDLDRDADPEMMAKAAKFFLEAKRYDKAASLLVNAGRFDEALDLCLAENVIVTEEMADKMTLPKHDDDEMNKQRNKILEKVANICVVQASYQLATRKYMQAGNKVNAMRALLKSGDTEKIIFFATKCREKEVYIMAANYLQTLDWRRDSDIMKNIVNFYTKGKALESLANFYDSCAQVEIDDYQEYDKALGALNEAYNCMGKAKMKDFKEQERKVSALQSRINLLSRFCDIRKLAQSNPTEMVAQVRQLMSEPDIEAAIRVGDLYALIIEYYASSNRFQDAYQAMQELRERVIDVNIAYYVSQRTVEAVHRAIGIPLVPVSSGRKTIGKDEVPEDM
jgi:intraflagellar transport protein 140